MAHFTEDRTMISHPSCLELYKGSCPVKNRVCAAWPADGKINSPLEAKINYEAAILRLIRNFPAGRHLPRFSQSA